MPEFKILVASLDQVGNPISREFSEEGGVQYVDAKSATVASDIAYRYITVSDDDALFHDFFVEDDTNQVTVSEFQVPGGGTIPSGTQIETTSVGQYEIRDASNNVVDSGNYFLIKFDGPSDRLVAFEGGRVPEANETIVYDPSKIERSIWRDGTVEYDKVSSRDGVVDGTDGDDSINIGYVDEDGDRIDNNDHDGNTYGEEGSNVDIISTGLGEDYINVGDGEWNKVDAGPGDDRVEGGDGRDDIDGGSGGDLIYGRGNDDTIDAGAGVDIVFAGDGDDYVDGGEERDTIEGGAGNDMILGGLGADDLYGDALFFGTNPGRDTIDAGGGADRVFGGAGDDSLHGRGGEDEIRGESGNDTLITGGGRNTDVDTLVGGSGDDYFVYGIDSSYNGNANTLAINDFLSGDLGGANPDNNDKDSLNNDFLDLTAYFNDETLAIINANGGKFDTPMDALRADARDVIIDGRIGGVDYGVFDERLKNMRILLLNQDEGGVILPQQLNPYNTGVVCYVAGTQIETPNGPRAIEDLVIGDQITTRDNGSQVLRWIGTRVLSAKTLREFPKLRPIRITAGAIEAGLPATDLLISPQHRVLLSSPVAKRMFGTSEVLVAAVKLLNLPGVEVVDDGEKVTYMHLLTDRHEIITANGMPSETLLTGPQAWQMLGQAARDEIFSLLPEMADLVEGGKSRSVRTLAEGARADRLINRISNKARRGQSIPAFC